MDGVKIGKVGKSESSQTHEIRTKRNCVSQSSKAAQDAIVRKTRYWQKLEKKTNARPVHW